MEAMIKAENLIYSYEGEGGQSRALDGASLEIRKGEFVAVVGSNGSGKSTLAKHLNAILVPASGRVLVNGMDTTDESKLYHIRRTVGMVFQNPDNQLVANVVEDDVAFGPENLGIPPTEIRRRVDEALCMVGMDGFALHAPHMLSGGQKQRVAIAGVLAMLPECIVLDEPTAMLDPAGRCEVIETITMLCREKGITVVLITHHMEETIGADRLVVMDKGAVSMDGPPGDIFRRVTELEALGLTVPETTRLLYELNAEGFNLPLSALSVPDCAEAISAAFTE